MQNLIDITDIIRRIPNFNHTQFNYCEYRQALLPTHRWKDGHWFDRVTGKSAGRTAKEACERLKRPYHEREPIAYYIIDPDVQTLLAFTDGKFSLGEINGVSVIALVEDGTPYAQVTKQVAEIVVD